MSSPPVLRCGNTLVVFDGPRRLLWSTSDPRHCTPAGLWPAPGQAAGVLDHLAADGNVLVLLDQERITVPMFADEAAHIPEELAARFTITTDGVLSELHLTALDWLPEHLRRRGLRFLRDAARLLAREHDLLLPPLLVEEPGSEPSNLRFAQLRSVRPIDQERIALLSDRLFAQVSTVTPPPAPEVSS
ncbi:hypothetical protein [Streptomyces sp. GbtcB7]|uniref:hypothetical protein n=1 Tax=Streptomyces sp. GbtcB7 TaxID=2824752 RepID=UPI001C2F61F5|nr:hypothetical protein [Streptomyces sp. GbtcB7]